VNALRVLSIALGLGGLALIYISAGWMTALGVFLALWGYGVQLKTWGK
jgi:hypothetical protein